MWLQGSTLLLLHVLGKVPEPGDLQHTEVLANHKEKWFVEIVVLVDTVIEVSTIQRL